MEYPGLGSAKRIGVRGAVLFSLGAMILFLPARAAADGTDLENTLEACRDGEDNDGDSHVDCDDQDCKVFVLCLSADLLRAGILSVPPGMASDRAERQRGENPPCHKCEHRAIEPELGLLCQDGKDNDGDGRIDCYDPSCQETKFCEEKIYYVPEPKNKPTEWLFSLGIGFAFPNWNPPESAVLEDSEGISYVVPYLPDIGPLADLSVGYLFFPWVGAGLKGMLAGTIVQSHERWYEDDKYKFEGVKVFIHLGAFVRFQYALERIVPFINFAGGYSYVQYRWVTFTRFEPSGEARKELDRILEPPSNHFTFAIEPGVDVFLMPRYIAAGFKVWLPIGASGGSGMDNTGALITLTYTPFWPAEPVPRAEYLYPKSNAPLQAE